MVGAFIMQGSEEMYRFNIKEISKEDALRMIRKYHYSNTLPKINKYFLGFFLDKELVGVVTLGWGTRPRHTIYGNRYLHDCGGGRRQRRIQVGIAEILSGKEKRMDFFGLWQKSVTKYLKTAEQPAAFQTMLRAVFFRYGF